MSALVVAFTGYSGFSYAAALPASVMDNNAAVPPSIISSADPNVMINLSIETPMQGAGYNDEDNGGTCSGRPSNDVGDCYFTSKDYLGYFNPRLCYDYDSGNDRFNPAGPTNADHSCNGVAGGWSGNFLNWATMTAIDEFRWALTGGHRSTDTAATTVLERGNMGLPAGHAWFPYKHLGSSVNVASNTVTPYSNTDIYITSNGTQFSLSSAKNASGNIVDDLEARVLVCEGVHETETNTYRNCKKYGANLKPEGLIQKNASKMRFAVMSFLRDPDHGRHGGVLRANMKYVGKYMPAPAGGIMANDNAEINNIDGTFYLDPDDADSDASGVLNSGVINYINKFGANGYKSYDPIGELFYECLNYYKNRGPTPEYSAGLVTGDAKLDGFPAITDWSDPIQHACQQNYIVGINDANPWEDKRLPGTSALVQSDTDYTFSIAGSDDWGNPGNSDPDINVTTETNLVGAMQGINGTVRNIGCVPGDCDMDSGNTKLITNLGQAFGTAPYAPKENSYYIAGLAYYAASNDIRSGAGDYEGMQTVKTFMIDTQEYNNTPLTGEMNMLWLAGKYGGFNEKNFAVTGANSNTYQPDQTDEWDEDGDGVPDNYVLANDPAKLVAGLTKAFSNIEGRISSGNAPAVVSEGFGGIGAFYQAIYSPKVRNDAGDEVQWVGQLQALFIDGDGQFREDGNGNAQLDNIATDNIVELRFNPSPVTGAPRTQIYRYGSQAAFDADTPIPPLGEIGELKAIWKARDELGKLDQTKIQTQRGYTALIDTGVAGRHIFTWNDKDGDGVVDEATEVVDFDSSEMNESILGVATSGDASDVVAFVRGDENISGARKRTLDGEKFLLGDIVNSAPVSVGQPGKSYDLLKGDTTYGAFRSQYKKRRQVIYVGANDGMLHAFNGGFYDVATKGFKNFRAKEPFESVTPKNHPLGAEIWAYIPGNLLPHLQWLKEVSYPHLYYVDGSPQAFEVNIFPDNNDHPNGWGTILVVNMRFGGGPVSYDHDGDGGSSTPNITARSAVVVLDVTNPEVPPKLLAEITDANLGFTTSKPTLVIQREPGDGNNWSNPKTNDWYLAFGSGPIGSNALTLATSDQNARLYVYDLKQKQFVTFGSDNYLDLGLATAFVGDPASRNWGNDFMDDAIYYGTVEGTVGTPEGGLYRMPLNGSPFGSPSALLSPKPDQPFTTAPTFTLDDLTKDRWVYAGTGRLFVGGDNQSATQQSFYGIKDPGPDGAWGSVPISDLQETTGLQIFTQGDMRDPLGVIPAGAISGGDIDNAAVNNSDFNRFRQYMVSKEGWFINFDLGLNSTRNIFASRTHRSFVLFPEYSPPIDACTPEGDSRLNALYFRTGTAFAGIGLGDTDPAVYNADGDILTASFTSRSYGILNTPGVFITDDGGAKLILTGSPGTVRGEDWDPDEPVAGGRRSWREIPLQ